MTTIAGVTFGENQKIRSDFLVDGTDYKIPVTIISGSRPGKTVLITAGVHSCEYVGIQTCLEMERNIFPEQIKGTLIIVPVVNKTGVEKRLPTLVPEDGKNLNRQFPGDPEGTASQRLAWFFTSKVFPQIDFYIDLHSGGIYEDLASYVYFVGVCDDAVSEYAKGAASLVDVPYMVKSFATTGCYNHAGEMGIPSLLLERGGNGRWSPEEVEANHKDLTNILKYVGTFDGKPEEPAKIPFLLEAPQYVEIHHSGFWYTSFSAGDEVKRGQEFGYVTDYRGNVLERVIAQHDGRVLYVTKTLWANKETEVVTYAKLCGGAECQRECHHEGHHHAPGEHCCGE